MRKNILVIVEGEKTESKFFETLAKSFDLNFDIYSLNTNIYFLYKKMKEIDFNGDIKDILSEIHPEHKEMLDRNFAYTYLIFDCDAHHPKKDDTRKLKEIVLDNIDKLFEMASHFDNETDPTIGKLYINYPMMESYRDCDNFFDRNYEFSIVPIVDIVNYKKYVSKKHLCKIHIDKFNKEQFSLLILQNLYKLNKLFSYNWNKPSYDDYSRFSVSTEILVKEKLSVIEDGNISVINTFLFLITDYFGNRNKFYDNLKLENDLDKYLLD